LFDTADRYMKGRHERMLGRAERKARQSDRVLKFGNIDNPDGSRAYGTPECVREACDASLGQLGIDTASISITCTASTRTCHRGHRGRDGGLVKAGKVRYIGLSDSDRPLRRASVHAMRRCRPKFPVGARRRGQDPSGLPRAGIGLSPTHARARPPSPGTSAASMTSPRTTSAISSRASSGKLREERRRW
jgi:hypothetical protein